LCRFGPIDLSQDAGCHVRYDAELDLPDPGDLFRVEASDNGADWEILQALTGQQLGTGTPALPDDFVDYSTVYLRFSLEADGDANVGDGVHVDNVRVRCPSDGYTLLQGTSMATPHVAGAAALLLAQDDSAAVAQLREWLLDGVDLKPAFDGRVASGGRLNLARSLSALPPWNEDIHRPQTTIIGGPAGSSTSTSATLSFVADESATFACSLNGSAFTGCSTPHPDRAADRHAQLQRPRDRRVRQRGGEPRRLRLRGRGDAGDEAQAEPCKKLRKKLKRAKSKKAKRKLRKKIRKRCPKKKKKKKKTLG
jgi:hypothetical protein